MTQIVVSRRDGILTAPDGTKYRVARGKTLAEADHPAVLANPGDWIPMVVTLTLADRPAAAEVPGSHEQVAQFENDVAELEETLASRDAELSRLAEGLESVGILLPAEEDREPGWLVDLALGWIDVNRASVAAGLRGGFDDPQPATPAQSPVPAGTPVAPPRKPSKRTAPPFVTRTGDDD
jgi:hypothetical protein